MNASAKRIRNFLSLLRLGSPFDLINFIKRAMSRAKDAADGKASVKA